MLPDSRRRRFPESVPTMTAGGGGSAKAKRGRRQAPAAAEAGDGGEEERPAVAEVLVDLVLSVLSQPSATLRDVGKTVIKAFGDEMNEGALELLVDVLRAAPDEISEGADDE